MVTKDQIKKKFADDLDESTAPGPLLHCLYALSKDSKLQGFDLVSFEGYRGKKPSGTQISKACKLLKLPPMGKKKASKKTKSKNGRRKASTNGRRRGSGVGPAGTSLGDLIAKHESILAKLREALALADG